MSKCKRKQGTQKHESKKQGAHNVKQFTVFLGIRLVLTLSRLIISIGRFPVAAGVAVDVIGRQLGHINIGRFSSLSLECRK
jgi:hypothetical protein